MKAVQVRRVQVAAETGDSAELYDCVRMLARAAGCEKAFVEAFGEREQFLKQEEKQDKEAS